LVGEFDFGWVEIQVEVALNGEACGGCRVGDEVDDGLVGFEWSATPVEGDSGEEAVFDLILFAGAGWVVADGDIESGGRGESGEFMFPEPGSVSVRSAAVGGDEDSCGVGVFLLSHGVPPWFDGGHGEHGGVVVHADRHPGAVVAEVVDPVGDRRALCRVGEVVGGHLHRLAGGLPLPAGLCVASDKLLFFVSTLMTGSPSARYRSARLLM
jgi:hypothetical protein